MSKAGIKVIRGLSEAVANERLRQIAKIIGAVDDRCMAADGPVTPTLKEMTQAEISEIYALASGKDQ